MKISIIRKIDFFGGPVVCRLLIVMRTLLRMRGQRRREVAGDVKNIIVIKYFGIGTILLASPALMRLKRRYPSARLTIMTLEENREICSMLPSFDRVVSLRIDSTVRFLISFVRAIFKTRQLRPEIVIDLEFITNFSAMTSLLVSALNHRSFSIGFHSPIRWRNRAFDLTVSFDHSRHISKIFMKVIGSICPSCGDRDVVFDQERASLLYHADTGYFDTMLARAGADARKARIICFNVNAGILSLHRRWPLGHFRLLAEGLLAADPAVVLLLIGGRADRAYVDGFLCGLSPAFDGRVVNCCGDTSISQLIGMLSRANLLVTNDSGPLHLAHILGTRTVSFFGPETPCLYGPLGENHQVFYKDLFCSPCLNIFNSKLSTCRDNACMNAIPPQDVIAVIREKYLP